MKVKEITVRELAILFLTSVLMDGEINFYEDIDEETKEYTGYWGAKTIYIFDGWTIVYGYYGDETHRGVHSNLNDEDISNVDNLVESLIYSLGKEKDTDIVYLIEQ